MFQDIINKNNKLLSTLIIALIIFLGVLIVLIGVKIKNEYIRGIKAENTIIVSGEGEAYARPDLAIVVFSVKSENKKIDQAMKDNTKKINTVIDTIKKLGVNKRDIKTMSFSINPFYEYQRKGLTTIPTKKILAGYEVNQSLQVKIRDLSKIGVIIKRSVDKGANIVGNFILTINNPEKIKAEAREKAIGQAKEKAKEIASQLGVKLLRIVNFSENNFLPRYNKELKIAEDRTLPKIETGENKIRISVAITYQIK